MRKWLLVFSTVGVLAVSLITMLFLEENGMDMYVISEATASKIEKKIDRQSEEMEIELKFAGETLPYDSSGKTFFLPLSMEAEEWEPGTFEAVEKPKEAASGEETKEGHPVEVLFTEDFTKQDKVSLLSENRAVPFYAVSERGYAKYYLKVTGLPILTFYGTEHTSEEGLPLFDMTLYDTDHSSDWVTKVLTTSTLRGNTSLNYEKKSLRLKLKEPKEEGGYKKTNKNLLGIRDDDDWILNSLYADNSRIRDKLAMDLWQEVGAGENPYGQNFGVKGEFVEVFVNGGYSGLYLLTHPIDRKQLGMDSVSSQIAAGEDVIERIYKKKYSAGWSEEYFTGDYPDANSKDYRGGFYLKGDTLLENDEEWEPLRELAACMEADDETFKRQIGEITDMDNLLCNWLFFQGIAGVDNENKNVYYVSRQKNTRACGYFIPWDMNLSFGALFTENEYYSMESMKEAETLVAFQPGMRAVELDAQNAREFVSETWQTWREDVFATENLYASMDLLMEQLVNSGAMEREMQRWPDGNASPDITFMKAFTAKRMEFVDEYMDGLIK